MPAADLVSSGDLSDVQPAERSEDRHGRRLTLLLIVVEAVWLSAIGYGVATLLS